MDGEIIETLWEPLNPIAPLTQKASPEHCREIINDHMNYSNWKKLLRMGRNTCSSHDIICLMLIVVDRLCAKYPGVVIEEKKSETTL